MKQHLFIIKLLATVISLNCILHVTARINEDVHRELSEISSQVQESLSVVPQWLKEYLEWHREQRLHHMDDPNTKFLTLACHRDFPCGGVSDRLRPLPYFLLAAHKMKRVFLIKWQKYELEDFFVPPEGGLDWRMPDTFKLKDRPMQQPSCLMAQPGKRLWPCDIWDRSFENRNLFVLSREDLYGENKDFFITDERPYGSFGDVVRLLFQPTPPLAKLIEDSMSSLNIEPKQYLSAHFRFRYPHLEDRNAVMSKDVKTNILHNAVSCVVHIANDSKMPVYFTSDESNDVSYMKDNSPYSKGGSSPVNVVALTDMNRFHSDDKRFNWEKDDPRDLYPVFLDLWLMGNSKCVSYGQGGFGMFGARLADEGCMMQHQISWNTADCPSV